MRNASRWMVLVSFAVVMTAVPCEATKKLVLRQGMTREGVTVEVQVLSAEEVKDIFGTDLVRRRVQPLLVKIHNGASQPYTFHKSGMAPPYMPAAQAARAAFENPIVVGGGLLKRGLGAVGRVILPVKKTAEERPVKNSELQAMFVQEELRDGELKPGADAQGFVFTRALPPDQPLVVSLINTATQQLLVFEMPQSGHSGAGG